MCSCCGEQVVPPTEKAAKYVLVIKVLMLCQIIISVMNFVAYESFIREGVFGLILIIFLFVGFYRLSFQSMMIYTFMSIFFAVVFLVYILTIVQRSEDVKTFTSKQTYNFATACISCAYYLMTSIFSFYPYREFKTIEYSENPVFSGFMMQSNPHQQEQEKDSNEADYNIDLGKLESEKGKKKKETFEVFKGKGVRIG